MASFRRIEATDLYEMRARVVNAGIERTRPDFDGDDEPETRHYGYYLDDAIVCCATLMSACWEGEAAWQLRGMATEPACRNQGLGARFLHAIESDILAHSDRRIVWCNARVAAIPFYERQGWRLMSEPFHIEAVGLHRKMLKRL